MKITHTAAALTLAAATILGLTACSNSMSRAMDHDNAVGNCHSWVIGHHPDANENKACKTEQSQMGETKFDKYWAQPRQ